MSATIRLGTQGWSYVDWNGVFYPPGSKQEDRLPFYAGVFDTVELDTTFYDAPKPTIARSWARHTPESFRFAAKLPRAITHEALLRDSAAEFDAFVRSLEPLGERLGPLLVQMPAEFVRDDDAVRALDTFLAARSEGVRVAVEFRHQSWFAAPVRQLLELHGASLAIGHDARRQLPVAGPWGELAYLRLHYGSRGRRGNYSHSELDRWRRRIAAWRSRREVFVYLDNDWEGFAPANARRLQQGLSVERRE